MYSLQTLRTAALSLLLVCALAACGDDGSSNDGASSNDNTSAHTSNCDGFAQGTTTLDGSDKPNLQAVFDYPSNWETSQYSANAAAGGLYVSNVSDDIPNYDLQYFEVRSPGSYEEVNSGRQLETHPRKLSFNGKELTVWQNTAVEFEGFGPNNLAAEYEFQNSDGETEFLFLQMFLKKRPDGPRGHCHTQAVEMFEDTFFSLQPNPDTTLPL